MTECCLLLHTESRCVYFCQSYFCILPVYVWMLLCRLTWMLLSEVHVYWQTLLYCYLDVCLVEVWKPRFRMFSYFLRKSMYGRNTHYPKHPLDVRSLNFFSTCCGKFVIVIQFVIVIHGDYVRFGDIQGIWREIGIVIICCELQGYVLLVRPWLTFVIIVQQIAVITDTVIGLNCVSIHLTYTLCTCCESSFLYQFIIYTHNATHVVTVQ